MKKTILLSISLFLLLYLSTYAPTVEFPKEINYQGMLTRSDGTTPVPNGTYSIDFRIWSHATSTSPAYFKWTDTLSVTVTNGLFNVLLGEEKPIDLPFNEEYWLEIRVGSDLPLSPRTKLTSVGYAYRSLVADSATVAVSAGSGGGWVDDGTVVRLNTSTDKIGIGTTDPDHKLTVNGDVGIGSPTQTGSLKLYLRGSTDPILCAENYITHGAAFRLYDDENHVTHEMRVDGSYEGGYLTVYRSAGNVGFKVDGNHSGSKEPLVAIEGSSQCACFDMSVSGNSSVKLPMNAIYDHEILDEPGVASDKEGTAGVTLTTTLKALLSRSIWCPESGYVLVLGTAQPQINHTKGTISGAEFGVSDSSSFLPDNQDVGLWIDDEVSTGLFEYPVTVHGLFQVSSDANTFYFLAKKSGGGFTVYDMQLTLVYFPTAYGTVEPTLAAGQNIPDEDAPTVSRLNHPDAATERAEAEAFNASRIERELAEMRAQLEALKLKLEQGEQNR